MCWSIVVVCPSPADSIATCIPYRRCRCLLPDCPSPVSCPSCPFATRRAAYFISIVRSGSRCADSALFPFVDCRLSPRRLLASRSCLVLRSRHFQCRPAICKLCYFIFNCSCVPKAAGSENHCVVRCVIDSTIAIAISSSLLSYRPPY